MPAASLIRGILGTATIGDVARGTGLSKSYVSRIVNGHRKPSLEVAAKLAAYLGVSIDDIYAAVIERDENGDDDSGTYKPANSDSETEEI